MLLSVPSTPERVDEPLVAGILRRSGLSQAELARRAGMPRSVVNTYVRGHREPGVEALERIAAAAGLGVTFERRAAPVDAQRAGRLLVQVLELAEALPFKREGQLKYPRLKPLARAAGVPTRRE